MPFWVPILVVVLCRILIGLCALKISEAGESDSKLLSDAHGMEMFVIYILVIQFLHVSLIQKLLFAFMALSCAWGILQFVCAPSLYREGNPAATPWLLARLLGAIGMGLSVYWAFGVVF